MPAFLPAALAASNVGTWERDPVAGLVRCDPTMAALFGLSDDEAAHGVTLERFGRSIHPDDRHIFREKVEQAKDRGGLIVLEYRVVPKPGIERWLLVRGRYSAAEPGLAMAGGRGIVIDITESKLDGHVEDRAFYLSSEENGESALETAADHAIAARRAIDEHDPRGTSPLRAWVDGLLSALGRALAAEIAEVEATGTPPRKPDKLDGSQH